MSDCAFHSKPDPCPDCAAKDAVLRADKDRYAALVEVARAARKIITRGDTRHACNPSPDDVCHIHWETCNEINDAIRRLRALDPKLLEDGRP